MKQSIKIITITLTAILFLSISVANEPSHPAEHIEEFEVESNTLDTTLDGFATDTGLEYRDSGILDGGGANIERFEWNGGEEEWVLSNNADLNMDGNSISTGGEDVQVRDSAGQNIIILQENGPVQIPERNLSMGSNSINDLDYLGSESLTEIDGDQALSADDLQDLFLARGGGTMEGNIDMLNNDVIGAGMVNASMGDFEGNVYMNSNTVTNLKAPESASDAARLADVDSAEETANQTLEEVLSEGNDAGGFGIEGLGSAGSSLTEINDDQVLNAGDVDDLFLALGGDIMDGNIDMDGSNSIVNPDRVDGIDVGNPGNAISIDGSDRYQIDSGAIGSNEISVDAVGDSELADNEVFTITWDELSDVSQDDVDVSNLGGDGIADGDLDMDGNAIRRANITHTEELLVSDTPDESALNTGTPNSAYIEGDLRIDGDFIGAGGADLAEIMRVSRDQGDKLEPGEVVTLDDNLTVKRSEESKDTGVAGVVSTNPYMVMAQDRDGVELALSGTAPVKVTMENGEIEPGDLLTTSSTPGKAMKCEKPLECQGAIIGKAGESMDEEGEIEMLITLS